MNAEISIDKQLIQLSKKGDCDSFSKLIRKYDRFCRNYIIRMTGHMSDYEDILQETYFKAFTGLHGYNSEYSFSTWLIRIARNNCMDYFRSRNAKGTPDIDHAADINLQAASGRVEDTVISNEFRDLVFRRISTLPEHYKSPFLLRYYCGMSYQDIAWVSDIPIGTVKSRINEGRRLLKKEVEK